MAIDTLEEVRDCIFISYRRDDARGSSGRLYDWLCIGFGRDRVFRDVHSIGVGKWRDKIDAVLTKSAVCVAVIGPRWANADNLPRLHDENDMVRHELVTALTSGDITLVPALVEGANRPKTVDLPDLLRPLFDDWNIRPVTENGWEDDTRRLIAEIGEATRLPVSLELDTYLSDASAAQQHIGQARHLETRQIEALRATVHELTHKLGEASADERPGLARAFTDLAHGDTRAAEDAFEREYEVQDVRVDETSLRTRADAARDVANLALLRDVTKAVAFYRKALELEPDHAETACKLGDALILIGDLPAARTAFSQALDAAIAQSDARSEIRSQSGLGRVHLFLADVDEAIGAFKRTFDLAETLAARDPANSDLQSDLFDSHNYIGNALVHKGDYVEALVAYRKGFAIMERLAARDPANKWQNELAIVYHNISNVLDFMDDFPNALDAARDGLAVAEALVARDPGNTEWQQNLWDIQHKVGSSLSHQGDYLGALAAYGEALVVAGVLAESDPANTESQRKLASTHSGISEALHHGGKDEPGALAAARSSFAITEAMTALDPTNALWQGDLARCCYLISEIGEDLEIQRSHAVRGRAILLELKSSGKLEWNEDLLGLLERQIETLGELVELKRQGGDLKPAGFLEQLKRRLWGH